MKENKTLVTVGAVVAVAVLGYVLWVSYANKKVREVVDESLARLEERMEANGNEVTITYDDVKVHGFSLRPHASVYKLHMKIEDKRRREMHLMLPELVYTPTTFDMRSYKLELLDSVTMIASERGRQESTLIDFSMSPALHVHEQGNGDLHYAMEVPEHITLTEVAEDGDAASNDKIDISFSGRPQVEWGVNRGGISLGQKAVFPQTTVSHDSEVLARADGLSVETQHSEGAGGIHSYATLARLDNLVFSVPELKVLNPVSLVNDVAYTGPVAASGATPPVEVPHHFQLKNVAWMSGLASVFASGDVHFDPAKEKLPYGQISLRFDDVDALLDYARQQRPKTASYLLKVQDALERFSGASLEEGGSVTINLDRQPNGRLYIGELSLEESLGLFIELMIALPDFSADDAADDAEQADDAAVEEEFDHDEEETVDEVLPPATVPLTVNDGKTTRQPVSPASKKDAEIHTGTDGVSVEVLGTDEGDAVDTESGPAERIEVPVE